MTFEQVSTISSPRAALDAWVREVVEWHFRSVDRIALLARVREKGRMDPRREVQTFDDLKRFGSFEDEWLRGGPVQRWIPKGLAGKPVFVFETGGTTASRKRASPARTSASTTRSSARRARRAFSERIELG